MNYIDDVLLTDNHTEPNNIKCEFCSELTNPSFSRFGKIYGKQYDHRILAKGDGFVVWPTLGQLFKGSLLILPTTHFETMAELPVFMLKSLRILIEQLERKIIHLGTPILFEHGAKCKTGGGCGIYHAHLHLVPVPGDIYCADVLNDIEWFATNLLEAYDLIKDSDHYILFRDVSGTFSALKPKSKPSSHFQSQYFRRALVEHFDLEIPWDWQEYNHQEAWLLDTLFLFGSENVSILR